MRYASTRLTAALLLLWCSALLCSCGGSSSGNREANEDFVVVSLAPSATRIIYELGAQNSLKGCTSYCSTAPEDSIEVVSDILTPNIEKIISLKPNLVVATAMLGAQHIRSLEKFGIKVLMLPYPQSVDEAFEQYLEIAEIVGKGQIAQQHLKEYRSHIEQVSQSMGKRDESLFIQIGADPLFAATEGTFLSNCAEVCGLRNIMDSTSNGLVNKEFVITSNPKWMLLILMDNLQEKAYKEWLEFKNLSAVKDGRILLLDDNFCQPTPSSIIGIVDSLKSFIEKH